MYSLPAMVAFGIIACSMPEVFADYPQRHLLATSWALCFRKIYVYHIIIFVRLRSNYEYKDTSFFCFSQIFFYLSQSVWGFCLCDKGCLPPERLTEERYIRHYGFHQHFHAELPASYLQGISGKSYGKSERLRFLCNRTRVYMPR